MVAQGHRPPPPVRKQPREIRVRHGDHPSNHTNNTSTTGLSYATARRDVVIWVDRWWNRFVMRSSRPGSRRTGSAAGGKAQVIAAWAVTQPPGQPPTTNSKGGRAQPAKPLEYS